MTFYSESVIGTRATATLNPMVTSCRPCCIRFSLLKNGSQSRPSQVEFAITAYVTRYRDLSTISSALGTSRSQVSRDSAATSSSISWRTWVRNAPSLMKVEAETLPCAKRWLSVAERDFRLTWIRSPWSERTSQNSMPLLAPPGRLMRASNLSRCYGEDSARRVL